jgi:hypothetical protein|tara:strand:+ start:859 stop:1113 length:255 start_codon:yes stop_codon:yes gene_type:complete
MDIKCILVGTGDVLITEIVELDAEIGEPDCKLLNPLKFAGVDDMTPWVEASNQSEYMIRSSDILTIADPTSEVIQSYLKLTTKE